ncbi:type II secretion protein F [uncultured Varibaculum sp.]|uniref:type II secretion protein F n=1 Tax=uncultured Varibaculum sp. TaxID=413896 RepID=UPI0027D97802|nr:type II secretion protein F [uncultured Varibaculum sp.]
MFILGISIFLGALPWFLPALPPRKSSSVDPRRGAIDPAVMLDLASSGLAGGAAIPRVLIALATASEEPRLAAVSRALIFGVEWNLAWSLLQRGDSCPEWAQYLAAALEPAWKDGVSPEALLKGAGLRVRASKDQRARQAAQKLSVRLVIPLGICQLPAFILLGIVPVILAGIENL